MGLGKYAPLMKQYEYDDEELWHTLTDEELLKIGYPVGAISKWRKVYQIQPKRINQREEGVTTSRVSSAKNVCVPSYSWGNLFLNPQGEYFGKTSILV
eukprot:UN02397